MPRTAARPSIIGHWATAAAVLTAALTGLILYVGPLTALVGRRVLVKDIHVIAGLSMPYSNGPIESANTKFKLLKRQMYGRGLRPAATADLAQLTHRHPSSAP